MIDRDPKFEIQYLISLVIAIVGSATAPVIQNLIDPTIASVLILIIMLHILIYTVAYTLKNASSFQLELVTKLNDASQWTLGIVSLLFLFYVGTIVTQFLWNIFIQPHLGALILFPFLTLTEFGTIFVLTLANIPTEGLFVYGIPLVIIIGLIFYIVSPLIEKVRTLRNIEITLYPDDTRVYNNFRDGNEIRVKIDNNTGENERFDIEFTVPEQVKYKKIGENEIREETLTVENEVVEDGGNYLEFFNLKYTGEERETGVATVEVSHEYGTVTREIDLILVPN